MNEAAHMEPCPKCNGTGVIEHYFMVEGDDENTVEYEMCTKCCGTGDANYDPICEVFGTED